MARVERNREFLTQVVVSSASSRKKLLNISTDDQVKTLFEVVYNINTIPFTTKEQKKLQKYKKILKSFVKRKWTVKKLRLYFTKQHKLVSILVDAVQSKIVDGVICSILSN